MSMPGELGMMGDGTFQARYILDSWYATQRLETVLKESLLMLLRLLHTNHGY